MSGSTRLVLALLVPLTGCTTGVDGPICTGEGDADMIVTPSLFNYDPLEESGSRVPVYVPAQGGTWTELDIELTGVIEEELGVLTVTVRLAGGDVISNPPPSMSYPTACTENGSVVSELFPVQLNMSDPAITPADLDELEATIVLQLQLTGEQAPITREYDVILDERTLN